MAYEDWNGTPVQVSVKWNAIDRNFYTFEAMNYESFKSALLEILDADVVSFSNVWRKVFKDLNVKIEDSLEHDREGFIISIDLETDGGTKPYIFAVASVEDWDSETFMWVNHKDLLEAIQDRSFERPASYWMK